MAWKRLVAVILSCAASVDFVMTTHAVEPLTKPAKISFDEAGALVVDGKKVFPITLTIIPGPEAQTPGGKHAYEQFADDGAMFLRTGGPSWGEDAIAREKEFHLTAAAHGMRCSPWLGWELANFSPGDQAREARLKKVIDAVKNSPGMGMWKGADEPEWGNEHNPKHSPPEQVANAARIIHENDPNHPIWLVQAPRGTAASMK